MVLNNSSPGASTRLVLALAIVLTVIAAVPRYYALGNLGFYGDEETTALPARALAEHGSAEMPSSMPYRRALPLTWLNAATARVLGEDAEVSYRVWPATLGTLTIPLLLLCARRFVGLPIAVLGALALALSEWHIVTSREARMYAPLLFFVLLAGFSIWRWAESGRLAHFLLAALMYLLAMSMHYLAIFCVGFALVPLVVPLSAKVGWPRLLSFAAVAAALTIAYNELFVGVAFDYLDSTESAATQADPAAADAAGSAEPAFATGLSDFGIGHALLLLLGAGVGAWLARAIRAPSGWQRLFVTGGTVAACSLAAIGEVFGAALAAFATLLSAPLADRVDRRRAVPAVLVATVAVFAWLAFRAWQFGVLEGTKRSLDFPYPYPSYFATMFPGFFLAFAATGIYLAIKANSRLVAVRAGVLLVTLVWAALGLVSSWAGVRMQTPIYPLFLIGACAAATLVSVFARVSPAAVTAAGAAVILSGLLGGHGIWQATRAATMGYGDGQDPFVLGFSVYPDHESAGDFVRARMRPGDIVVAEDALEQHWYAGRVDYWLRDAQRHAGFLYTDSAGVRRDIYVGAAVATDEVVAELSASSERRVWVITSPERELPLSYYLSERQLEWLSDIESEREPAHVGRDGLTRVYCVACDAPGIDAASGE